MPGLRDARPRWQTSSDERDRVGFQPFSAIYRLDPHALTWRQDLEATAAQRGYVDKDVLAAAIGRNKAIALVGLEPLDRALQGARWARAAPIGVESRGDGGAQIDAENAGDERPLGAGADIAGDRSAFAYIL